MTLDEQIEKIEEEIMFYEEENESISKYEWLYDVLDSLKLLKIMQEV